MEINKTINPRFENFLFDWDYYEYILVGGYGSSKSYHVALKIILKCLEEKRKVLVVREVFETHRDSTFSLLCEILQDLEILGENKKSIAVAKTSPLSIKFKNGSQIIFRGLDKVAKLKSINDISIVWVEEASEVKYAAYKEIRGRLRHPNLSLHMILSTNPVGTENWTYEHFFKRLDDTGNEIVRLDDEKLYKKKTLVNKGTYYHHSTADDNLFLPQSYISTLEEMQEYDPDLYRIAREGRFGLNGVRVLPQFKTASSHEEVMREIKRIPEKFKFNGLDFGFEVSYNALVRLAVDDKNKILYIYQEYYKNQMTDDKTVEELRMLGLDEVMIIADSASPKDIQFYRQEGFRMRGAKKSTRLEAVKKVKRFKKIICSPECTNTIRELKTLVYKKDARDRTIYDEFNIDAHTFSAVWYALDTYTVADIKEIPKNSKKGG